MSEHDQQRKSYFNDATDNFMKELVDFNSRRDFDKMMGQIENSYFEQVAGVSKVPYQGNQMPQFPPKPFSNFQQNQRNQSRSNSSSRSRGRSPEDRLNQYKSFDNFVDTVKILNSQRDQGYQQRANELKKQRQKPVPQRKPEPKSKQDLFNQPFFQTFIEKQQYRQQRDQMQQQQRGDNDQQQQQQQPPNFNQVSNQATNALNPQSQAMGASFRRFVAGPSIIERNPLSQPLSTVTSNNYSRYPDMAATQVNSIQQQIELRDYDLTNPDTQYLRYKHLMSSQYYNLKANSGGFMQTGAAQRESLKPEADLRYADQYGDTTKSYMMPGNFKLHEIAAMQQEEAKKKLAQDTGLAKPNQGVQLDQTQQRMLKPATVSIYQLPQNPKPPANPQPPRAEYYRAIQMNTSVRKEVIDSLGGIQDSLKPIEKSLKEHEMRPFDIEPNYYEDLMISRNPERFQSNNSMYGNNKEDMNASTRKEFLKKTLSDKQFASVNGMIVSASPYRAVIRRMDYSASKIENNNSDEDEGEEQESPNDRNDDDFERDENDQSRLFSSYRRPQEFNTVQNQNEGYQDSLMTPVGRAAPGIDQYSPNNLNSEIGPTQRQGVDQNIYAGMNNSQMTQNVNDDSSSLRQQRDTYLKKFNEDRSNKPQAPSQIETENLMLNEASGPNLIQNLMDAVQSPIPLVTDMTDNSVRNRPISPKQERQNQSVRRESAHLRNQREMFLSKFQ